MSVCRDINNNQSLAGIVLAVAVLLGLGISSGWAQDVIEISSIQELQKIGNDSNYPLDGDYVLTQDIDASETENWNYGKGFEPIGEAFGEGLIVTFNGFEGIFDGQGFVISDLSINRPNENYVGLFGAVDDAVLRNIRLENAHVSGGRSTGALAGYLGDSAAQNVFASVDVQGATKSGGLIGEVARSHLRHSGTSGSVSGSEKVGGLVGGSALDMLTTIVDCYSHADVTGDDEVGGLMGYTWVAGVFRSYSIGAVSGAGEHVGGLLGGAEVDPGDTYDEDFDFWCYWDVQASGQESSALGSGRTTTEMREQGTYEAFNLNTIWMMDEANEYPVHRDLAAYAQPQPVVLEDLEGSGSLEDPYLITSADELNAMRLDRVANYRLANDIDLRDTVVWNHGRGWEPIAHEDLADSFIGTLDGAGHMIRNLYISRPSPYEDEVIVSGFLGLAMMATVRDLKLEEIDILHGRSFPATGGVAGILSLSIVEDVYVSGRILAPLGETIGGLAGSFIGSMNRVASDVDVLGQVRVGGLVGGFAEVPEELGDIEAPDGRVLPEESEIWDAFAIGRVTAEDWAGGLVGAMGDNTSIHRAYSAGNVRGDGTRVGGLVGGSSGAVSGSYWDQEASGIAVSAEGEGRSTAEMTWPHDIDTTYIGWDFDQIWEEDRDAARNMGYPYLTGILPSGPAILSPIRSGTLVAGDILRFTGETVDDPDMEYVWEFGDGRVSAVPDPDLVSFQTPGEYKVTYSVSLPEQEALYPDTRTYTVVADTGNHPDLRVTDLRVPTAPAVGQPIEVSYTVRNVGQGPAEPSWIDAIYLSEDSYLNTTDIRFGEVAVDNTLAPGESYQDTITGFLPAVDEGMYHLILSVNDTWQVVERHRLNNEEAESVAVQIPELASGISFPATYEAGQVQQYYRISNTEDLSLMLNLIDADPGLDIYVRYGAVPTRGVYDYRVTGGELLIPSATEGDWFVLVFGDMTQSGSYNIGYETMELALTTSAPSRHAAGTDLMLTLNGSGFLRPLDVLLVSNTGDEYEPEMVDVEAYTRASAWFPAGTVPPGQYTVRIKRAGQVAERPNAIEIVSGGEPRLDVRLHMPEWLGYMLHSTIFVEYANVGDAPMPAPLLFVTATQNGREAAMLTLDDSRIPMGLYAISTEGEPRDLMPAGFATSVQFLASGETPGVLQPGESRQMPVYYVGWRRPWDAEFPPIEWEVGMLEADDLTGMDWDRHKHESRPDYIQEDAWDEVWNNFRGLAGDTYGDYITMLGRNAQYLYRQGLRVDDAESLLAFSFRQAEGLSPLDRLAEIVDADLDAPGMPLVFERTYATPLSRRFELGPLGRGWVHNWQIERRVLEHGAIAIVDNTGTPRIFQRDRQAGAHYAGQPGDYGELRAEDEGERLRLTEKDGTSLMFGTDGTLEYVEDTNGNRIECTYANGRLTRLTHSAGPELTLAYNGGFLTSITDHHGRTTEYDYMGEYLMEVVEHNGLTTTHDYEYELGASQHALTLISAPDGTTRVFSYDARGRLSSIHRGDATEQITFTYPAEGRVNMVDALENTSRFFFDHWGRVIGSENPLGEMVRLDYDNLGNLVALTDPEGFTSTYAYDSRGNLTGATDALRQTTRFSYTRPLNRLESMTDANGNQTVYNHDAKGNIKSIVYPDGSREQWQYDSEGNPTSWTNRRGHAIAYDHDNEGRLTEKIFADGSRADYRYDARGNIKGAENELGITTFTFDQDDYLKRIDYPGGQWLLFDYDNAGRRTSSLDHLNHWVYYHYDDAGRLERLKDKTQSDIVVYDYDSLGRLKRKTLANGVYTTYAYDAAGRLETLINHGPDDEALSRFSYAYDRRGRRAGMQTHYGAWSYEYNTANQLIRASLASDDPEIPDQELTYEYDAMGNRVGATVNGQTDGYALNALNQYTQAGDTTYVYDLDGNLIREEGPDGTTVYTYDHENRLVSVVQGEDGWEYSYDALGNRVTTAENGAVTHYVKDPVGFGNVVGQYDDAGNLIARYTYGQGLVSRDGPGNARHFYTFDGIGSVSELTNDAGAAVNHYAHLPFGESLNQSQTVPNPFQFVGELGVMTDPTGLNHMRARPYSPVLGRFTAPDPIGLAGGDPNLYRYALNNPVSLIDPMGYSTCAAAAASANIASSVSTMALGGKIMAAGMGNPVIVAAGAGVTFYGAYGAFRGTQSLAEASRFGDGGSPVSYQDQLTRPFTHNAGAANSLLKPDRNDRISPRRNAVPAARGFGRSAAISAGVGAFCALNQSPIPPFLLLFMMLGGDFSGTAGAFDPNQKLGPAGYGPGNYLVSESQLTYRVDYENLETATAPAHFVTIRDPLSEKLDLSTFELTQIGFGSVIVTVPPGQQYFEKVVDYVYNDDDYEFEIEVRVEAWLEGNTFCVNFSSIDPITGLPPQDIDAGFLPPEDGTGRGQGFVSYRVRPTPGLPSGTEIRNVAIIQFDLDLEIATNQIDPQDPAQGTSPDLEALVTFDGLPPTSSVDPLPAITQTKEFIVSWTGEDDEHGSGVGSYDIYVRVNNGSWSPWLSNTSQTSAVFSGEDGQAYDFYSVATDNVGNREVKSPQVEATTRVDTELDFGIADVDRLLGLSLGGNVLTISAVGVTEDTVVYIGEEPAFILDEESDIGHGRLVVETPSQWPGAYNLRVIDAALGVEYVYAKPFVYTDNPFAEGADQFPGEIRLIQDTPYRVSTSAGSLPVVNGELRPLEYETPEGIVVEVPVEALPEKATGAFVVLRSAEQVAHIFGEPVAMPDKETPRSPYVDMHILVEVDDGGEAFELEHTEDAPVTLRFRHAAPSTGWDALGVGEMITNLDEQFQPTLPEPVEIQRSDAPIVEIDDDWAVAEVEHFTLYGLLGPAVYGDVNLDGVVDARDIQLVINHVLGLSIDPRYEPDVTGSETVDARDIQAVINIVLGIE